MLLLYGALYYSYTEFFIVYEEWKESLLVGKEGDISKRQRYKLENGGGRRVEVQVAMHRVREWEFGEGMAEL